MSAKDKPQAERHPPGEPSWDDLAKPALGRRSGQRRCCWWPSNAAKERRQRDEEAVERLVRYKRALSHRLSSVQVDTSTARATLSRLQDDAASIQAKLLATRSDNAELQKEVEAGRLHAERQRTLAGLREKLADLRAKAETVKLARSHWNGGWMQRMAELRVDFVRLRGFRGDRLSLNRCLAGDLRSLKESSEALMKLGDRETQRLSALRDQNFALSGDADRVAEEVAQLQRAYWGNDVPLPSPDKPDMERLQSKVDLSGQEASEQGIRLAESFSAFASPAKVLEGSPDHFWSASPAKPPVASAASSPPARGSPAPRVAQTPPRLPSKPGSLAGSPMRQPFTPAEAPPKEAALAQVQGLNLTLRQEIEATRERLEQQRLQNEIAGLRARLCGGSGASSVLQPSESRGSLQPSESLGPQLQRSESLQSLQEERAEQQRLRQEIAARSAKLAAAAEGQSRPEEPVAAEAPELQREQVAHEALRRQIATLRSLQAQENQRLGHEHIAQEQLRQQIEAFQAGSAALQTGPTPPEAPRAAPALAPLPAPPAPSLPAPPAQAAGRTLPPRLALPLPPVPPGSDALPMPGRLPAGRHAPLPLLPLPVAGGGGRPQGGSAGASSPERLRLLGVEEA